jgi:enoyl-CoA hydratase
VAIGLTMPRAALAIMHYRLTPATYQRAVAAGYLDELVQSDRVRTRAVCRLNSCCHTHVMVNKL